MLKISFKIASHTLILMRRAIVLAALLLFLILSGVILVLRYSVLPGIDQYHEDITAAVSRVVGQAVEIDRIQADWRGFGPHLNLAGIRLLNSQRRTVLELQNVDVVVSWKSLLFAELRLASLEIDQPDLMIRRDINGNIRISGIDVESDTTDGNVADMLLNQSRIVIKNAHISWLDEKNARPILAFDHVNFLIENDWDRHRIAMRGEPPAGLSTRIDLRADLQGRSFEDMQAWRGEIYVRLDYTDIAAWKAWLPLPVNMSQGKGAVRGWAAVRGGKLASLVADLALFNVQSRLEEKLPSLDIRSLNGRVTWRDHKDGVDMSLNRFTLSLFDGFTLQPTDVKLKILDKPDASAGDIELNLLGLEEVGKLMTYLPVSDAVRQRFAEFSPRGTLESMQLQWSHVRQEKLKFRVKGKFSGLALKGSGSVPEFSGLSGEVDGNEKRGSLLLNSRDLIVHAPQILPAPLAFDTLSAQSGWEADGPEMEFRVSNLAVTNKDIAGIAYGSYGTMRGGPGKLDLNVHLIRASIPNAEKYIPLIALGEETRTWLKTALLAGESNDFNLRIKGNLNDFPYVDGKRGIFRLNGRMKGVELAYDPEWPKLTQVNADLLINGRELTVIASSGLAESIRLQNVRVDIPDLTGAHLEMGIRGDAYAENKHALAYIAASPVHRYIGEFTDGIAADGTGKLSLKARIPFATDAKPAIEGNYRFTDSNIDMGNGIPVARKVNGDLQFTESGLSTRNISGQILGGPARLYIDGTDAANMKIRLSGQANFADALREDLMLAAGKVRGDPRWSLDVNVSNGLGKYLFSSSLQALESDLPEPFAKLSGEPVPLKIEVEETSRDRRVMTAQWGNLLNAHLIQSKNTDHEWMVNKGIVNFGNVVHQADRSGLWIIGTLPQLSLEGWPLLSGLFSGEGGTAVEFAGADFAVQKVTGYGNQISDLHIKASAKNGKLTAQVASTEINGDLTWSGQDGGMLSGRFANLDLALKETTAQLPGAEGKPARKLDSVNLPAFDLVIERLSLKGRQMGRVELMTANEGPDYRMKNLRLSNPDGVLSLDGLWKRKPANGETAVNIRMELRNAGSILARSGYPDSMRGGSGKLEAILSWPGAPWMYSSAQLSGKLSLDTGKGQFLQVDPGAGKLLSILSLQALPKRITLDFDDVFSKGFEFDSIKGGADIREGQLHTDNLVIDGSSAKVFMAGDIDLKNEQQNLRVKIVPAVGNSAALLSALMATPIIGVTVFLTSKAFNDPLGQMVAFEYNITGNWTEPKVEKIGDRK